MALKNFLSLTGLAGQDSGNLDYFSPISTGKKKLTCPANRGL
jgi:hypothetical protein